MTTLTQFKTKIYDLIDNTTPHSLSSHELDFQIHATDSSKNDSLGSVRRELGEQVEIRGKASYDVIGGH
jgi:hypothetical protein